MGERNTAMHNELHSPKIHPYLALAIGAVALSTAAVLVKMTAAPAAVVAFYRMFFSFLIMTPMIVLFYRSEWRVLDRRDWLFCTLSGLFLGMHFILWFESLQYTSVASSVVLVTAPTVVYVCRGILVFQRKRRLESIARRYAGDLRGDCDLLGRRPDRRNGVVRECAGVGRGCYGFRRTGWLVNVSAERFR